MQPSVRNPKEAVCFSPGFKPNNVAFFMCFVWLCAWYRRRACDRDVTAIWSIFFFVFVFVFSLLSFQEFVEVGKQVFDKIQAVIELLSGAKKEASVLLLLLRLVFGFACVFVCIFYLFLFCPPGSNCWLLNSLSSFSCFFVVDFALFSIVKLLCILPVLPRELSSPPTSAVIYIQPLALSRFDVPTYVRSSVVFRWFFVWCAVVPFFFFLFPFGYFEENV